MGVGGSAMNRSSLTEETPATPSWVDARLHDIFAPLGERARAAKDAYADCLAGVRGDLDVDVGHDACRRTVLDAIGEFVHDRGTLDRELQALEAEISGST